MLGSILERHDDNIHYVYFSTMLASAWLQFRQEVPGSMNRETGFVMCQIALIVLWTV